MSKAKGSYFVLFLLRCVYVSDNIFPVNKTALNPERHTLTMLKMTV